MKLSGLAKASYGIGAVGKDMVYALAASYIMYFYQDIIGLSATFVGAVLMAARVFDALNDPLMGIVVAKTNTRFGRFRPWLLTGTVLNAFVLYALFAAPQAKIATIGVYFAIMYILWGVTYTMMDIPYWSMIPALTDTLKDRENLSVVGRTCAGVGYSLVSMTTVLLVSVLGKTEREGFRNLALIIAVIFIVFELICFLFVKERELPEMHNATVKEMLRALFRNDQAIAVVVTIILVNTSLYINSNLLIYFFKYDAGGAGWRGEYTVFTTFGSIFQIVSMMAIYPLLRKKFANQTVFRICVLAAIPAYLAILLVSSLGLAQNVWMLIIPGVFIFAANGILGVLTTVFLSNTVDYGEMITGKREESVIFSMQTFVVKAASGLAVFLTGVGLDLIGIAQDTSDTGAAVTQSAGTLFGLRSMMTLIPAVGLLLGLLYFRKKFKLTDDYVKEIAAKLHGGSASQ